MPVPHPLTPVPRKPWLRRLQTASLLQQLQLVWTTGLTPRTKTSTRRRVHLLRIILLSAHLSQTNRYLSLRKKDLLPRYLRSRRGDPPLSHLSLRPHPIPYHNLYRFPLLRSKFPHSYLHHRLPLQHQEFPIPVYLLYISCPRLRFPPHRELLALHSTVQVASPLASQCIRMQKLARLADPRPGYGQLPHMALGRRSTSVHWLRTRCLAILA